ncbi:hypothetical protein MHH96_21830 [Niallia sp. FSL K6-0212]|uniref:hypothetical protein n=1 Tax=Niallia sp. FSL K6-0212 TaxID=2921423 RepID=UPI0030F94D33
MKEIELKEREIWNSILKIETNSEKLLINKLIDNSRIHQIKDDFIKEYELKVWEYQTDILTDIYINPNKIIGTRHSRYNNKNLYEVLEELKRADINIYNYIINPDYYVNMNSRIDKTKLYIAYKKHEDRYYICGDGNHRFFLSKILNLDKIFVNEVYVYEEDLQLKSLLEELKELGFDYHITENEIESEIEINSSYVSIFLTGEIKNNLSGFISSYKNLSISSLSERIYKISEFLSPEYENKYEYSNDIIKNAIHKNFLRLINHKRKNTL